MVRGSACKQKGEAVSNHFGPEGCAPDDQRCEALVRATGSQCYYEWTKHDRRCSRRANQCREGIAVCYIHARSAKLERFVAPVRVGAAES